MILFIASIAIAAEPVPLAVIGLGPAELAAAPVAQAMAGASSESDLVPLDTLRLRLVGTPTPRTPDVDGLRKMVADAAAAEARFDSAGAQALRQQVLATFDGAVRMSPALRRVALTAMLDTVAALTGDGKRAASEALARDLVRRFGRLDVDIARYPPAVRELLAAADATVSAQPRGRLEVRVDVPGKLLADGLTLGAVAGLQRFELPAGSYRLWLIDEAGRSSLPYPVTLGGSPVAVELDTALDDLIELEPVISLRCDADCEPLVQRLGRRLGVAAVALVRPGTDGRLAGLRIETATGATAPWEPAPECADAAAVALAESRTMPRFDPLYLVPFGVGQFVQDRPLFAAGWAGLDVGLLAWHLVAWQRHSTSVSEHDFGREPGLRRQRNLSAGLFYGAVVAGVVEAVIVALIVNPE